jgi:anti-anti-sigma regulatory factor
MWRVDFDPDERLLTLRLAAEVEVAQMRALAQAHARALEATGGEPFCVLVDLRGLHPLDGAAADVLGDMKRVAARLDGYLGRAVLVDSPTVAMQQRNATFEDGGDDREVITMDEAVARRFVDRIRSP